jgi:hypothetical protein
MERNSTFENDTARRPLISRISPVKSGDPCRRHPTTNAEFPKSSFSQAGLRSSHFQNVRPDDRNASAGPGVTELGLDFELTVMPFAPHYRAK